MKFCSECGTMLEEDAIFCPECGTKAETDTPSAEEPAPIAPVEPAPSAPPPSQPQARTDDRPSPDSRYAPISAWGYVGNFLLLSLPIAGFILTIVWACGGCRKINKRNMARGILLSYLLYAALVLIIAIVAILVAVLAGAAIMPILRELFYELIYSIY